MNNQTKMTPMNHINNFETRKPKSIHSVKRKYLENPKTKRQF